MPEATQPDLALEAIPSGELPLMEAAVGARIGMQKGIDDAMEQFLAQFPSEEILEILLSIGKGAAGAVQTARATTELRAYVRKAAFGAGLGANGEELARSVGLIQQIAREGAFFGSFVGSGYLNTSGGENGQNNG